MHSQLFVCFFMGLSFIAFLSMSSASVISCPPNSIQQELNPKISQICFAIEQALQESAAQQSPSSMNGYTTRLVDELNTNLNTKRQDVDHVFLRFGRRYGL